MLMDKNLRGREIRIFSSKKISPLGWRSEGA